MDRSACYIDDWHLPVWSSDGGYLAFEVAAVERNGSPSLPTGVVAWQPV